MKIKLGNNIIASYKRLSYQPWYALAEFVDNSTQAYFNNVEILDPLYELSGESLTVKIDYTPEKITIWDNSIGMDYQELQDALIIGNPPAITSGRSRYGLGMKTAACWFGDLWTIETKKYDEDKAHKVTIDVEKIASGENDLNYEPIDKHKGEHYTLITINELNSQLYTNTISKIKKYLRSMYRLDFKSYGLKLYWQGDLLNWENLEDKLYVTKDGHKFKDEFSFEINGKSVTGWVGLLGKGHTGREEAGFSIIQAKRVIEGWPKAFKPASVFGDQEGGTNNLVNQRVVGEIYLDGFAVSHTKDKILWQDDEHSLMEKEIGEVSRNAVYFADKISFKTDQVNEDQLTIYRDQSVELINSELKSFELKDFLVATQPPPEKIINISYSKIIESVVSDDDDAYVNVEIGEDPNSVRVKVFFSDNSEFEPYVIIELTPVQDQVNVIINTLHPHYQEMASQESLLNFIRHCIYDGVSEWKAIKLLGEIKPNTVKFIKDGLLRIPFEIQQNKAT